MCQLTVKPLLLTASGSGSGSVSDSTGDRLNDIKRHNDVGQLPFAHLHKVSFTAVALSIQDSLIPEP